MAKQTSSKTSATPAKGKRAPAGAAAAAPPKHSETLVKADAAPDAKTASSDKLAADGLSAQLAPTHEQIALRAFELYMTRSYQEGSALNDWLAAERELRA